MLAVDTARGQHQSRSLTEDPHLLGEWAEDELPLQHQRMRHRQAFRLDAFVSVQ